VSLFNKTFKIRLAGDPILKKVAAKVQLSEIKTQKFQDFLDKMIITMKTGDGIGLAAPQIGISKRIFIVDRKIETLYEDASDVTQEVFINPRIESRFGDEIIGLEGCMSLPNFYGDVPRSMSITITAHDRKGKPFTITANDFYSRVIQHEFDHLDGILFIERIRDLKSIRIE